MTDKNFLEIKGKRLCYYTLGAENQGQYIYMLNGWAAPNPIADLYPLATALASTYKVVILNLFGYGDSDMFDGQIDFTFNLDILKEIIQTISKGEKFSLIGHSLGSVYSLCLTNYFCEQLNGVFLLDCYPTVNSLYLSINILIGKYVSRQRTNGRLNRMSEIKLKKYLHINKQVPEYITQQTLKITRENAYNENVMQEFNLLVKTLKNNIKNNCASQVKIIAFCRNASYLSNKSLKKYYNNIQIINLGRCSHFVHHERFNEILNTITTVLAGG